MQFEAKNGDRRVKAISSEHTVVLLFDWPKTDVPGLLGFAIQRFNPDGSNKWLEGNLGFPWQKEALPSSHSPIQKMNWLDYDVESNTGYDYRIFPMNTDASLDEKKSVYLTVRTEDNLEKNHKIHFNRAAIDSQFYVNKWGLQNPELNPEILKWLAHGLDDVIANYIGLAIKDKSFTVDAACYHLDHPAIIKAFAKLGKRCRLSICWKQQETINQNKKAVAELKKAGVKIFLRKHVPAISHNKYIILKKAKRALFLLTGSCNFTVSGVSMQNNVCHIINDNRIAETYAKHFEAQISDDTAKIRALDGKWEIPMPDVEVNFSPHSKGERIDLKRYTKLVRDCKSSVMFATFRATDGALISAITNPGPKIVVRGIVDGVHPNGGPGDVILYHKAKEKNPAIIAAEPYANEPKRPAYKPLIHHKFILLDWNKPTACLITGSANYSQNSSVNNDENTLIIHDNKFVNDMYFCEFMRLYEHYRTRWYSYTHHGEKEESLEISDRWADKYYQNTPASQMLQTLLAL